MLYALHLVVRGIDGINWLIGWVLASLLLVMTVLISWQVVARYAVGNSLTFSDEVARFSMVWLAMLGAAFAYRRGALIAVDMLSSMSGALTSRVLHLVVAVISCIFAYVLLTQGWSLAEKVAGQTAPSTRVSMAWLYASMPAGAALILLNSIAIIIETVTGDRAPS